MLLQVLEASQAQITMVLVVVTSGQTPPGVVRAVVKVVAKVVLVVKVLQAAKALRASPMGKSREAIVPRVDPRGVTRGGKLYICKFNSGQDNYYYIKIKLV